MLGPLFVKELIEVARRRRYYAARVTVGAAILLALLPLSIHANFVRTTTGNLATIGEIIFDGWSVMVGLGLVLFVPASVCGLIAGEKDAKTLDTLLTTCLHEREILIGKLASRLLVGIMLGLTSLPALGIASWFGGFDSWEVLQAVVVHATILFFSAAVGVYYSTVTQKPYIALIRTYLALAILWWMVPTATRLFFNPFSVGSRMVMPLTTGMPATVSAPAAVLVDYVNPISVLFRLPNGVASEMLIVSTLASVALAIGILTFTWRRLRVQAHRQSTQPRLLRFVRRRYRSLVDGATAAFQRRRNTFGFRRFWQLELASRRFGRLECLLGDRFNPILTRNVTANVYDPERYVASMQVLLWLLLIAGTLVTAWLPERMLMSQNAFFYFALPVEVGALFVFAVVLSASSIVRERQCGSWEQLLLTDLTANQFLSGIFWGVLRALWPTFGLVAVTALLLGASTLKTLGWLGWTAAILAFLVLTIVTGMAVSLVSRRIAIAIAGTIVALALAHTLMANTRILETSFLAEDMRWIVGIAVAIAWFVLLLGSQVMARPSIHCIGGLLMIPLTLFYVSQGVVRFFLTAHYYEEDQQPIVTTIATLFAVISFALCCAAFSGALRRKPDFASTIVGAGVPLLICATEWTLRFFGISLLSLVWILPFSWHWDVELHQHLAIFGVLLPCLATIWLAALLSSSFEELSGRGSAGKGQIQAETRPNSNRPPEPLIASHVTPAAGERTLPG